MWLFIRGSLLVSRRPYAKIHDLKLLVDAAMQDALIAGHEISVPVGFRAAATRLEKQRLVVWTSLHTVALTRLGRQLVGVLLDVLAAVSFK